MAASKGSKTLKPKAGKIGGKTAKALTTTVADIDQLDPSNPDVDLSGGQAEPIRTVAQAKASGTTHVRSEAVVSQNESTPADQRTQHTRTPLSAGPIVSENGAHQPATYAVSQQLSNGNLPPTTVELIREDR